MIGAAGLTTRLASWRRCHLRTGADRLASRGEYGHPSALGPSAQGPISRPLERHETRRPVRRARRPRLVPPQRRSAGVGAAAAAWRLSASALLPRCGRARLPGHGGDRAPLTLCARARNPRVSPQARERERRRTENARGRERFTERLLLPGPSATNPGAPAQPTAPPEHRELPLRLRAHHIARGRREVFRPRVDDGPPVVELMQ